MRKIMSSQWLKYGLIASFIAVPTSFANAEALRCQATIDGVLAENNIDRSTIDKMYILAERSGGGRGGGGYISAYNGWVDFNNCKGSLVVKMSTKCDVKEVYTRYNCTFPGIKHY